jgi:aryl-alcohol dehydrogenase-like predicted oxidoreductase
MSDMEYRQLGDSGLTVSVVGLGCNNFGRRLDAARTDAVVNAAVDAGITLFDTADIYHGDHGYSEELLGKALGSRRDDVVIATKFGGDMQGVNGPDWGVRGSRRYIRKAVESSLRRLGTDWIDLYQLHFPDPVTPIEDWVAKTSGLERFVSAQNQYSLLERDVEDELVPACEQLGIGILPFFPLASGLLSGKYKRGEAPPEGSRLATQPERLQRADFDKIEALETFAAERDLTLIDVAIGGLAAQPAVASVIAGATTPQQIEQNVTAGLWEPTPADLAALDELT